MECGYPIDYVLDKMALWEAQAMLDYKYLRKKDDWEMSRLSNTIYINAHSKRKFKVEEVLQFPWEKEEQIESKTPEEIQSDREAALEESMRIAKLLNSNNEESGD